MPLGIRDRKAELFRRGHTLATIAEATGFSDAHVSRVLNEKQLDTPEAEKVMRYVADQLGLAVEEVFPVERIEGFRRKDVAPVEAVQAVAG